MKFARKIVDTLEDKKGEDILLLDIHEVAIFADYFVICSGTSDRMIGALLDAVVDEVKQRFHVRPRVEGLPREGWMLADYGDVILHIFSHEQRDYYQLEELWSEGRVILHLQ